MRNPTRLVTGAFVAAALAVPLYAAASSIDNAQVTASPACLAWFGNREDGKCLSYSNGNGVNVGTPSLNACPGGGSTSRDGCGWSTGPLLPGTTINQGIGVGS